MQNKIQNKTRLVVVQALYQREINKSSTERLLLDFPKLTKLSGGHGDYEFFEKTLRAVIDNQAALDKEIAARLPSNWQLDRLDKVLLALLRAGLAEREDKTMIRDYVALAHSLLDGKTAAMANAILDKSAKSVALNEEKSS